MLKVKKFMIILIISIFPSFSSEEWNGKIYKENGITVVESKGKGIWGEDIEKKVLFSDTLSLGLEEGDEKLIFGDELEIAVDSEENIYILDSRNFRVLKFDKNGKFLWKIGRKGQGPGELERPYKIKITSKNNFAVLDYHFKIHFFTSDGKYLSTLKSKKIIHNIEFLNDGRMLVCLFTAVKLGYTAEFWSEDGKFLSDFPEKYFFSPEISSGKMLGITMGLNKSKDKIFLSIPDRYEIREYDLNGDTLRKIRRDFPLKPPRIEIKGKGARIEISDISGPTFILKNGNIVNFIDLSGGEIKGKFLDFFDVQGRFLGSLKVKENLIEVDQKDNFYFLQYEPFPKIIRRTLKIIY
jgi:hypothetical protein